MVIGTDAVLIAAPTAKVKDYALDAYVAGAKALRWPEKQHVVVDMTNDEGEHADRLSATGAFDVVWKMPWNPMLLTLAITRAWEDYIIPYAHEASFPWILSLESDVVPSPDTLQALMDAANRYGAGIVGHTYERRRPMQHYPLKHAKGVIRQGLGCTLFRADLIAPGENCLDYFEVYLWEKVRYSDLPMVQLENVLPIRHIHAEDVPANRLDTMLYE